MNRSSLLSRRHDFQRDSDETPKSSSSKPLRSVSFADDKNREDQTTIPQAREDTSSLRPITSADIPLKGASRNQPLVRTKFAVLAPIVDKGPLNTASRVKPLTPIGSLVSSGGRTDSPLGGQAKLSSLPRTLAPISLSSVARDSVSRNAATNHISSSKELASYKNNAVPVQTPVASNDQKEEDESSPATINDRSESLVRSSSSRLVSDKSSELKRDSPVPRGSDAVYTCPAGNIGDKEEASEPRTFTDRIIARSVLAGSRDHATDRGIGAETPAAPSVPVGPGSSIETSDCPLMMMVDVSPIAGRDDGKSAAVSDQNSSLAALQQSSAELALRSTGTPSISSARSHPNPLDVSSSSAARRVSALNIAESELSDGDQTAENATESLVNSDHAENSFPTRNQWKHQSEVDSNHAARRLCNEKPAVIHGVSETGQINSCVDGEIPLPGSSPVTSKHLMSSADVQVEILPAGDSTEMTSSVQECGGDMANSCRALEHETVTAKPCSDGFEGRILQTSHAVDESKPHQHRCVVISFDDQHSENTHQKRGPKKSVPYRPKLRISIPSDHGLCSGPARITIQVHDNTASSENVECSVRGSSLSSGTAGSDAAHPPVDACPAIRRNSAVSEQQTTPCCTANALTQSALDPALLNGENSNTVLPIAAAGSARESANLRPELHDACVMTPHNMYVVDGTQRYGSKKCPAGRVSSAHACACSHGGSNRVRFRDSYCSTCCHSGNARKKNRTRPTSSMLCLPCRHHLTDVCISDTSSVSSTLLSDDSSAGYSADIDASTDIAAACRSGILTLRRIAGKRCSRRTKQLCRSRPDTNPVMDVTEKWAKCHLEYTLRGDDKPYLTPICQSNTGCLCGFEPRTPLCCAGGLTNQNAFEGVRCPGWSSANLTQNSRPSAGRNLVTSCSNGREMAVVNYGRNDTLWSECFNQLISDNTNVNLAVQNLEIKRWLSKSSTVNLLS